VEEVNELAEWEYGEIACCDDGYSRDENKQWFEDGEFLGEEVQAEVDKDKILRDLCKDAEEVSCGPLRAARHGVVCVVLQGYPAEE
jgi:hypothetical protein